MELSSRIADRIAPLIGVGAGDVHVGDSHQRHACSRRMVAAARLRPDRSVLVVEPSTFPTDGYIAAGVADLLGLELRWCDPADPLAAVDDDVALLSLTHVDFRTGAMFDLAAITAAAHDARRAGAVGPVPLDRRRPGRPHRRRRRPRGRLHLQVPQRRPRLPRLPLGRARGTRPTPGSRSPAGWATRSRSRWRATTTPPTGIGSFGVGHPAGARALGARGRARGLRRGRRRRRSGRRRSSLTDLFIDLVDERLPGVFEIVTPREHERRGSQVSLRHPPAYGVVQALIARDVIGDFRDPDVAALRLRPALRHHRRRADAVEHARRRDRQRGARRTRRTPSRNAVPEPATFPHWRTQFP